MDGLGTEGGRKKRHELVEKGGFGSTEEKSVAITR